jgi:carbon storage regulator
VLVLSRKESESLKIGPDITVMVVSVERGKVRLGITAPRSVPVYRTELLEVDHRHDEPVLPPEYGGES